MSPGRIGGGPHGIGSKAGGRRSPLAGAPEPPVLRGDWTPASGYAAGRELAADPDVTAVFVANDDMAIGAMRALAQAGISVPDQLSLVGFDDIPSAEYLSPPLTTIPQEFDAFAARGLANLVQEIEAPTGAHSQAPDPLAPRLIVRQSTATPPSTPRRVSARRSPSTPKK